MNKVWNKTTLDTLKRDLYFRSRKEARVILLLACLVPYKAKSEVEHMKAVRVYDSLER